MSKNKILDFKSFAGGFNLLVETDNSEKIASVVLVFPNGTDATIKGDPEVVKQIVERLDGINIEYAPRDSEKLQQ